MNGAPIEVYQEIMADARWPAMPFIEVARLLTFTQVKREKQSAAHKIVEAMNTIERVTC